MLDTDSGIETMLKNLSFRTRLLLAFWGILLLALLLPSLYYRHTLSQEIVAETQLNAIRQLNLSHWLLLQEQPFHHADQFLSLNRFGQESVKTDVPEIFCPLGSG